MPTRIIDKEAGINVEVLRRAMKPENLVKRPRIVKKDREGNYVRAMYKALLQTGVSEADGRPIFHGLKFICPVCPKDEPKADCKVCGGKGVAELFTNTERVPTVEGKPVVGDIVSYAVDGEGHEEETSMFTRSDAYVVLMKPPREQLDTFILESFDELDSPAKTVTRNKQKFKVHDVHVDAEMYRYAEELIAKNVIACGKFVKARGFKEWLFAMYPYIKDDGTFGLVVGYWQAKKTYQFSRPIPQEKIAEQVATVPAKSYLDIEKLVA